MPFLIQPSNPLAVALPMPQNFNYGVNETDEKSFSRGLEFTKCIFTTWFTFR